MRAVLCVICFCVLQMTVQAWVAMILPDAKEAIARGGHCYTDSYNLGVLAKYEEKRIASQCAIATCLGNRAISLTGCGVTKIEPPCRVVDGDLSRPYPKCCFKIECPEGMEEEEKRLNANFI